MPPYPTIEQMKIKTFPNGRWINFNIHKINSSREFLTRVSRRYNGQHSDAACIIKIPTTSF